MRRFFPSIARVLKQQYGYAASAMTFTTPATAALSGLGIFEPVHNLAEHLKQWTRGHGVDECIRILEHADLCQAENLSSMVHGDRIISQYRFERVMKMVAGIYDFMHSVLGRVQPDAVLGEIASVTEWMAWSAATRRNIPYLVPYPTPVAKRFFFIDSPAGGWEAMERLYGSARNRELSADESRLAEDFLRQFRSRRIKPPFLARSLRSPVRPDPVRWAQRIGRIPFRVQTYLADRYFEVGSYHGTPPWESIWADTRRVLRHVAAETAIFENKTVEGKKAYFALHTQPEFTTDVRAPFFANQLALVENIAKSLPMGYRLIVKEHPAMKGERELGYYRHLKRLYNVQLLSPSVDSHELILNSDVVLAITGTTAWEGILYEKPVIAFGPLGYQFFDLLYECRNVTELPHLLPGAIRTFRPNRNLLLKLVWALLESAHTGEWGDSLGDPRILDQANVHQIAKAVAAEMWSRASAQGPSSLAV